MTLNEVSAAVQIGFPILSILIVLPLAGVLLVAAAPPRYAQRVTMLVALAELILTLLLVSGFKRGGAELQFVERWGGILTLGIDGISALFLPLTALLTVLATLTAEAGVKQDIRGYAMALLGLCGTLIGAFAAADVMLFWLFLTLEMVPGYVLIARHGTGAQRRQSALHYAAMMIIASALMFLGLEMLSSEVGGATDFKGVLATPVPAAAQSTIFVLLAVGLAIKTPVFPFHTWLPRVLEQGPVVGVGVFLVGVKIGAYGFLRLVLPVLPEASAEFGAYMIAFAVVGMVYGALIALAQTNLRRLLAFASVSHISVVVIGLFSLGLYGLQGGLLQMLSIGLAIAGLYFIAGFLHTRVGTPEESRLGGLAQRTPLISLAYLTTAMGAVGMPGTSGFNGEHLVVLAAYKVHWGLALCVGLGTVLTAAYFLRYFLRAFIAVPVQADAAGSLRDLDLRERVVAFVTVGLVFWIGLYTSPFISVAEGSLRSVAAHIAARQAAQPDAHSAGARAALEDSQFMRSTHEGTR